MNGMKQFGLLFFVVLFALPACSPVEMGRRVIGTSIEALEEEEEGRFSRLFDKKYSEAFEVVKTVLEENEATIYLESIGKGYLIAMDLNQVFPYCIDTTEVGVFFRSSRGRLKIDVVSLNQPLAKFVSELLFDELEKKEITTENTEDFKTHLPALPAGRRQAGSTPGT